MDEDDVYARIKHELLTDNEGLVARLKLVSQPKKAKTTTKKKAKAHR